MSSGISEGVGELFIQLVEWEVLGKEDLDPKALLRQVPLADLAIAAHRLDDAGGLGEFVSSQMVEMELLYRQGKIEDWNVKRDGYNIRLSVIENKKGFAPLTRLKKAGATLLIALAACVQTMRVREEMVGEKKTETPTPYVSTASMTVPLSFLDMEPAVVNEPVKPRRVKKLLNKIIKFRQPQVKPAVERVVTTYDSSMRDAA